MSNFNTSGLLQALDRIKPELKPLPQHFITSQDQHTRELYATLLAAVLLSDGQVSEPQSRLFGMLLQSMQLEPVPARFFELAQQLDAGQLKQLIQALNHQDQQCALMIDALILARLDSALSQAQTELLSELLDCFGLSTDLAVHLTAVAGMGLGSPKNIQTLTENLALTIKLSALNPISTDALIANLQSYSQRAGTYIDSATGLMWSRISIGQKWVNGNPQGQAEKLIWDDANTACERFRFAGFDDWRLPTIQELRTLMINDRSGYAVSQGLLVPSPTAQSSDFRYWSITNASRYGTRNGVDFSYGIVDYYYIEYGYNVRAVRDITKKNPSEPTGFEIQI